MKDLVLLATLVLAPFIKVIPAGAQTICPPPPNSVEYTVSGVEVYPGDGAIILEMIDGKRIWLMKDSISKPLTPLEKYNHLMGYAHYYLQEAQKVQLFEKSSRNILVVAWNDYGGVPGCTPLEFNSGHWD